MGTHWLDVHGSRDAEPATLRRPLLLLGTHWGGGTAGSAQFQIRNRPQVTCPEEPPFQVCLVAVRNVSRSSLTRRINFWTDKSCRCAKQRSAAAAAASESPAGRVATGGRVRITSPRQASSPSRFLHTCKKNQRAARVFHGRPGTYGPEELDLILSFSTFSHGCTGARSAASAGSAPLSILAYS